MPGDRSISPAPDIAENDKEKRKVSAAAEQRRAPSLPTQPGPLGLACVAAFNGAAFPPLKADEIACVIRILCWEIPPLVDCLTQMLTEVNTWLATKQPLLAAAEHHRESSAWALCASFEALMQPINQMSVKVCLVRWSIEDFTGDEATRTALSERWFALERRHEDLKRRRFAGRSLVERLHERVLTLEKQRKRRMGGAWVHVDGENGGEGVAQGGSHLDVERDEGEEDGEVEDETVGERRIEEGDVPAWITSL